MSDDPRAHFATGGAAYAAFRPDWPEGLVASLAAAAPGRGLAVDVGCGSGQLTARLAPHFDRVMGFDVAPAQLAAATRAPGILYAAALAEALPVATGAAALIAVAQAAHWFDLPAFYAEARRIAAPGAVLALLSYGPPVIDGPLAAPFAALRQVIAPCWPPERAMVEAGYRDIPFPFPDLPLPPAVIEAEWPLDRLLGYVETWSATRRARAAGQGAAVDARLAALAAGGRGEAVTLRFPIAVRAARLG